MFLEPSCSAPPRFSLIARGLPHNKTAEVLNITLGTVRWHVNTILAGLNVAERRRLQ